MRRAILLALMMIPLCACGAERDEAKFESFRESLQEAQSISFTMDATMDLGDEAFSCVLDCEKGSDSCRVTVVEPQELQGVTADITQGVLSYDGLELYIGELPEGISPVSSGEIIANAILSDFVEYVNGGEVRTYLDESTAVIINYDFDAAQPLSGEIIRDGRTVISCGIRNFTAE